MGEDRKAEISQMLFDVVASFTNELYNSIPVKFSESCFRILTLKLKVKLNIRYLLVSHNWHENLLILHDLTFNQILSSVEVRSASH